MFAPIVVVAVAFVAYCLNDMRSSDVRWVPKWAWALFCVLSIPLGGLLYLTIGREEPVDPEATRRG